MTKKSQIFFFVWKVTDIYKLHAFCFYPNKRENFLGTNNSRSTFEYFFVLGIYLFGLIMGLVFFTGTLLSFFSFQTCSTSMLWKWLIELIHSVPDKCNSHGPGIICTRNTCRKWVKSCTETRSHTKLFETIKPRSWTNPWECTDTRGFFPFFHSQWADNLAVNIKISTFVSGKDFIVVPPFTSVSRIGAKLLLLLPLGWLRLPHTDPQLCLTEGPRRKSLTETWLQQPALPARWWALITATPGWGQTWDLQKSSRFCRSVLPFS